MFNPFQGSIQRRSGASYLSAPSAFAHKSASRQKGRKLFPAIVCAFMAFVIVGVGALSGMSDLLASEKGADSSSNSSSTQSVQNEEATGVKSWSNISSITPLEKVYADDDEDAKNKLKESGEKYIVKDKDGNADFWDTLDKANGEDGNKGNDFGYVIRRLLSTQYLNDTKDGVAVSGTKNAGKNCNVNAPGAGTLLYHNCDVPNLLSEFLQDGISFVSSQGPQGAEKKSATLTLAAFGLPSDLPAGGAAVNPSERKVKYSGLELYGYSLRYTNYNGEWDHIKVMTSARTLSNFGAMDDLRMSATAVFKGVSGAVNSAATNFVSEMSQGNVLGAIGGAFSGFFGGGAASTINSILDTSDLNVFNTNAWYRIGYGNTLYNARELSSAEVAAKAKSQLINIISNSSPDKAGIPADLMSIQNGPSTPRDAISKCEIVNASGKKVAWGDTSVSPGPSKDDCQEAATKAYDDRQGKKNPPKDDKPQFTYSIDGTQKKETIASWKQANSSLFSTASTYNMTCSLDEKTDIDTAVASLRACWNTSWNEAATNARDDVQEQNNEDWKNNLMSAKNLIKAISDGALSFNAPWNRYACVDSSGKDIYVGGKLAMVYDEKGNVNPKCKPVRAPVQNGFFGNGYLNSQEKPQTDTRWAAVDRSVFGTIFPMSALNTAVSNGALAVSKFFTRVSNTFLSVSFSPVLEVFGLDKTIAKMIKTLRESLFFPFAVLLIGISAVMVMMSVVRGREGKRTFLAMGMMIVVFISGAALMFKPEAAIKFIDTMPAQIEAGVVGAIYDMGSSTSDNLCTVSGTSKSASEKGLDGSTIDNPKNGTRTLMCENWRAFVFNPWVQGQWGTDFSKLYAKGYDKGSGTLNNTNAEQVGTAAVNMGGGKTVHNWALYQLDKMTAGTASKSDLSKSSGSVDPNFYRVVDAQAGPNNGAGTDGTYFQSWSGGDPMNRLGAALWSVASSFVGMLTFIAFCAQKIVLTFGTVFMLLFLPFMFLAGLFAGQGNMKLKGYLGGLLGMMVQRVVLVVILAVALTIIVGFGTSSQNYLISAILVIIACIAFMKMRKPLLDMVFSSISSRMGRGVGEQFMRDPGAWTRNKAVKPGGLISNFNTTLRRATSGTVTGAIGARMAGGSMADGAREARKYEIQRLRSSMLHKGIGVPQTMAEGFARGQKQAAHEFHSNEKANEVKRDINFATGKFAEYDAKMDEYDAITGADGKEAPEIERVENVRGESQTVTGKVDLDGNFIKRPMMPKIELKDQKAIRRANVALRAKERLDKAIIKAEQAGLSNDIAKSRADEEIERFNNLGYGDVVDDLKNQDVGQISPTSDADRAVLDGKVDTLRGRYDGIVGSAARRQDDVAEVNDRKAEKREKRADKEFAQREKSREQNRAKRESKRELTEAYQAYISATHEEFKMSMDELFARAQNNKRPSSEEDRRS